MGSARGSHSIAARPTLTGDRCAGPPGAASGAARSGPLALRARWRAAPAARRSRSWSGWGPATSRGSTIRWAWRSAGWSTSTGARPACAARRGPSAGSVGNIAGLRDGTLDLALVQSDTQAEALAGTGAFAAAGPFAELRAVMALYPEPLTIVARADAGIAGVEDLAGKRVALGAGARGPGPSPTR